MWRTEAVKGEWRSCSLHQLFDTGSAAKRQRTTVQGIIDHCHIDDIQLYVCSLVLCRIITWLHVKQNYLEIISAFYFTCNYVWNYFKIISEAYCSSWIFSSVFNVAEIILKQFQSSFSGWNNFEIISDVVTREIKLFQRSISHVTILDVVTCEIKRWIYFKII